MKCTLDNIINSMNEVNKMIEGNWFRLSGIVVYAGWDSSTDIIVGKLRLIIAPEEGDDSRFSDSVLVAGLMDLSSIKVIFGNGKKG